MLSPNYLDLIEFNDVVLLYNKLNMDITADIIKRISSIGDITDATKQQIKKLVEINGKEIFENTLINTASISRETKEALKKLYDDMAKEDLQGYKELYEYRGKKFKLSESQIQILNVNRVKTNKILKNMTNTIAFRSVQMYVDAIDSAYMQVVSGAVDYTTVLKNTIQDLAKSGVTLKDSIGRNIQLEIAVRRNVLTGIKQTANIMNRDIEKELGCDGYEVTAHNGARPTHAEFQGKQYALTKKDSIKFGVEYWGKVKELWKQYNCKHTYFGIILGVSKPQYSDEELKEFKEAKVFYNGKEISLYDVKQKQRQLENKLRNSKRSAEILKNANQDNEKELLKVNKYQSQLRNLCRETGLKRDYSRESISKYNRNLFKNTEKSVKIFNEDEERAINRYISSDSYKINEKLRNKKKMDEDYIKFKNDLDSALNKCDNYKGNIVRVLYIKNEDLLKKFIEKNKINNEVFFDEYLSFSTKDGYNDESNIIIYTYSKRAKDLRKYNPEEQEILYPRNSKFITRNIVKENNKYYILWEEKDE